MYKAYVQAEQVNFQLTYKQKRTYTKALMKKSFSNTYLRTVKIEKLHRDTRDVPTEEHGERKSSNFQRTESRTFRRTYAPRVQISSPPDRFSIIGADITHPNFGRRNPKNR